jgi:hypothetical protein
MAAVWAVPAEAHVKWVVEFDITKPPRPIGEVLSGRFVEFFLVSVFGVYLFFLADRFILRKGFWPRWTNGCADWTAFLSSSCEAAPACF